VEISDRQTAPFFDAQVETECQVFFKYYDPKAKKLQYVARLQMAKSDTPLSVSVAVLFALFFFFFFFC
jgi:hypothetical protein